MFCVKSLENIKLVSINSTDWFYIDGWNILIILANQQSIDVKSIAKASFGPIIT